MIILCGLCGGDKHDACTGFLRTDYGFCGCADRGHDLQAEPVPLEQQLAQLNRKPRVSYWRDADGQ